MSNARSIRSQALSNDWLRTNRVVTNNHRIMFLILRFFPNVLHYESTEQNFNFNLNKTSTIRQICEQYTTGLPRNRIGKRRFLWIAAFTHVQVRQFNERYRRVFLSLSGV